MRSARNYLQMVDRLYRRACEEEGVDPSADVVMFGKFNTYGNKFKAVYNQEKYERCRRLAKR